MSNIATPIRCIWMRPVYGDHLEVVILGNSTPDEHTTEAENIAAIFIHIRKLAEGWPGWDRVDVLAMGPSVVGLRCHLGKNASGLDVLAEGLRMFVNATALQWSGGNPGGDSAMGMMATW